jgi:hypothetical protein
LKLDGFIGGSYELAQPSASAQRTVNLYLETMEGGARKGNMARLVGTPGLRTISSLGIGPVRGVYFSSTSQLFVVSNANLYELFSDLSAAVLRPGALNSTTGRVSMADNGATLMIGDGTSTAYTAALAANSAVAPAADANCPGGHVAWQDTYFINTVPGTNRFQISGNNNTTYDPLDVATKEGRPDNVVIILSVNRLLWLFGQQTTEVWYNSGAPQFPFQRNESAFIETGTVSALSVARFAGSVAWVGNDERGRGTVWWAQGFQPTRISTHAVEAALASYANLSSASAFTYQQNGHEFYQLTVSPSATDNGGTWVFDFSEKQWHERTYLDPILGEQPHRAWCGTVAFGQAVVGDRQNGNLYVYDPAYYLDGTTPIRRVRQTKHVTQDEKRIRFDAFQLQSEPGVGLSLGQGQSPVANLSWSNDGGHTWSNEYPASMGSEGKYKHRIIWRRLGVSRDRVWRVETSEPVPVTWLGAEVDMVELGR